MASPSLVADIQADITRYAGYVPNAKTLNELVQFGKAGGEGCYGSSVEFLSNEAATRLAHIIVDLQALPNKYKKHKLIQRITEWYLQSFTELVELHGARFLGVISRVFLLEFFCSSERDKSQVCVCERVNV
jgi:hypothetical protein